MHKLTIFSVVLTIKAYVVKIQKKKKKSKQIIFKRHVEQKLCEGYFWANILVGYQFFTCRISYFVKTQDHSI